MKPRGLKRLHSRTEDLIKKAAELWNLAVTNVLENKRDHLIGERVYFLWFLTTLRRNYSIAHHPSPPSHKSFEGEGCSPSF